MNQRVRGKLFVGGVEVELSTVARVGRKGQIAGQGDGLPEREAAQQLDVVRMRRERDLRAGSNECSIMIEIHPFR